MNNLYKQIQSYQVVWLLKLLATAITMLCFVNNTNAAATTWSGFKDITNLEVVNDGGFIITFSTPLTSSSCTSGGHSSIYIYPNQGTMNLDGVKTQYATALAAYLSGKQINVFYDSSAPYCWGTYVIIQ